MKIAGEIIGAIAIIINFLIYQQKDRKNVRGGVLAERANKIAYDGFYGQYMQTFSTKVKTLSCKSSSSISSHFAR